MNWIKSINSMGVVALIIIISSCGSDPEFSTVDLNFTLTYEDQPLVAFDEIDYCLLYTSPSPRDRTRSRMPSSA